MVEKPQTGVHNTGIPVRLEKKTGARTREAAGEKLKVGAGNNSYAFRRILRGREDV